MTATEDNVCGAAVYFEATAFANCGEATITYSSQSGEVYNFGTHNIAITATDNDGNTNSCVYTITVIDSEAPIISCPNMLTVPNEVGECGASVLFNVSGYDNCGDHAIAQMEGFPSGSFYPLGVTNNTFTATDASGNETSCIFSVTVTGDAGDADCDGIQNTCDVCPNGDDNVDNNNDGIPDCSQLLAYSDYSPIWKCGNNKIKVCHGNKTKCYNINTLAAHFNHGDNIGPCTSCSTENRVTIADEDIDFELRSNPITQDLMIGINGHPENASFRIYDVYGRLVISTLVDDHSHEMIIDMSNFVNGQYTIQFLTSESKITKKFIVLK